MKDKVTNRKKQRLIVYFGIEVADNTAFTRNVSETGVFINTNKVYKPGTTIKLKLNFPERSFSMLASVIWAKRIPPQLTRVVACGMGVRFIDPGPEWFEFFNQWHQQKGGG
ncbi:MAG: PilZ domain-containing protein [Thermodesulfobacteriota bacterium]